ncbi:MAG: prolipoprotein diacylglyceryl transferase [Flavobacteriales bacterium]
MYPNLYFAFLDLLGWDLPALKLINSFGFFVALAFLAAHALLKRELRRMSAEGHFSNQTAQTEVGHGPQALDLGLQALMGFIFGWKVIYLMANAGTLFQGGGLPQAHLFSTEGNVTWGILGAVALTAWRWWEVRRDQLPEPKKVEHVIRPEDLVGGITMAAAVGGIAGAKLFHLLEYPDELVAFLRQPSLNAFLGGLTIYGGLIVGGLAVYFFARKNKMNFLRLADATAPGLLLAYGIGRMGCQISGDGDWGIPNPNPKPGWLSWAPDWVWSYAYPNNVNAVYGPRSAGYTGKLIDPANQPWPAFEGYGTYLDPAVFPTPIYETTAAVLGFLLLWAMRTRWKRPGQLFAAYLMFNGMERFWVEKIRVNATFEWLGMTMTQAELISVCTFLGGVALWAWTTQRPNQG